MTLKQQWQQRARLYQHIRAFFSRLDYLEVDTPLLSASTNTDIHIESIEACVCNQQQYLQTSPEFAMKRLLAGGSGSIFQICHAFRDEEEGRRHRAEFSLLEWYSVGFDYHLLMDQVEALMRSTVDDAGEFQRLTYAQSFEQTLGIDIFNTSLTQLQQAVAGEITGIDEQSLTASDCLDLLISEVIVKRFEGFVFVTDYPAEQASLARISAQDSRVAERFELFYGDMELANGFSELTDGAEQRARFGQDNARRKAVGRKTYPVDEAFLSALEQGLPACAGVALGLDRLLMVLQSADSITQVNAPF